MSKNAEIANLFNEMADLHEILGIEWRPRAYRNAARSLESAEDVEQLYKKGGKEALMELPGIGPALADKIIEYLTKGKIKEYDKLTKKIPAGVHDMMHIQGMGPKKAWKLYKKLKIKNIADLTKAAKAGKIQKLEGFGTRSEQDILSGIETVKKSAGRELLGKAWILSNEIVARLKKVPGITRIEPSGSLRRRKETIGDIDVLVISNNAKRVMDAFTTMPNVVRVLAKGPTKSSVVMSEGMNADCRVLQPKNFGAALQYFTGGKEHNIAVRNIAIKKGFKLNEYGLFKGTKQVAGKTEQELYQKLGLRWMEPELRENTGEIQAAKENKLPKLIEYRSLKGDLHMHTTWSDGANSIIEMAQAAKKLNYKYIAITDHSKTTAIANGLDESRLKKQYKDIQKAR